MPVAAWRVTAAFVVVALIGVGGVGAWASVRLDFNYALLTPVSFVVYAAAGFFAARAQGSGALAAGIVALLDSGSWATFGGVGPQPTTPTATPAAKAVTVLVVTVGGVLLGVLGAWLSRRFPASAAP